MGSRNRNFSHRGDDPIVGLDGGDRRFQGVLESFDLVVAAVREYDEQTGHDLRTGLSHFRSWLSNERSQGGVGCGSTYVQEFPDVSVPPTNGQDHERQSHRFNVLSSSEGHGFDINNGSLLDQKYGYISHGKVDKNDCEKHRDSTESSSQFVSNQGDPQQAVITQTLGTRPDTQLEVFILENHIKTALTVSEIGYPSYDTRGQVGLSLYDGCSYMSYDDVTESLPMVSGYNTGMTDSDDSDVSVVFNNNKKPRYRPHKGQFAGRPRPVEDGKVISYTGLRHRKRQAKLEGFNASFDTIRPGSMIFYLTDDTVKYAVAHKIKGRFFPTAYFKQVLVDYNLILSTNIKVMSLAAARLLRSTRDEKTGLYHAKSKIDVYEYMRHPNLVSMDEAVQGFQLLNRMIDYFNTLCCVDEQFVKVCDAVDEAAYVQCDTRGIYSHPGKTTKDLYKWTYKGGRATRISAVIARDNIKFSCDAPYCSAAGSIHAYQDCAEWHSRYAHLRPDTHMCIGMGSCGGKRGKFSSEQHLIAHFEKKHTIMWNSFSFDERVSAIRKSTISQSNFPDRD